jgi:hypothetical protein
MKNQTILSRVKSGEPMQRVELKSLLLRGDLIRDQVLNNDEMGEDLYSFFAFHELIKTLEDTTYSRDAGELVKDLETMFTLSMESFTGFNDPKNPVLKNMVATYTIMINLLRSIERNHLEIGRLRDDLATLENSV